MACAISLSLKPNTFAWRRMSGEMAEASPGWPGSALAFVSRNFLNASISSSSRLNHGSYVRASWYLSGASRERTAFRYASRKVRPMAITSPTDFICVPSALSAPGNFSNAKRGIFTTT